MKHTGTIVLSFEEAGDLNGLLPWKNTTAEDVHTQLQRHLPIGGFIFLSTCNRVEIIYSLSENTSHDQLFSALLQTMPALAPGIRPTHFHGELSVRHLIRLAMGLESLVLGETEIRAQMKTALEAARTSDKLDSRLQILFRHIFQEARQIRAQIPLNNLPLSVATLATRKLLQTRDAPARKVVVIGSGPMSRQAAVYLAKSAEKLILVNRRPEKVADLAKRLQATVCTFDQFLHAPETLGPVQAIITATSRPEPFLTPTFIQRLLAAQNGNAPDNLTLVDMALPPDADPACADLKNVTLITLETLHAELEQNRSKRIQAAALAKGLVKEALHRIQANLIAGLSGPVMTRIQKSVREKSREHLNQLLDDRLSHLSNRDRRLIYTWAIQAHRDMNRIHRQGVESVLRNYFSEEDLN